MPSTAAPHAAAPYTAADVMSSPAITVLPVPVVAGLLSCNFISAAPVCTADGTLVGIVSEGDLLKPLWKFARAERNCWLDLAAAGEDRSQAVLDFMRQDQRKAADVMTTKVITADERTRLPRLAEMMVVNRIKRVVILRDGRVAGMVSRADIVSALARNPELIVS